MYLKPRTKNIHAIRQFVAAVCHRCAKFPARNVNDLETGRAGQTGSVTWPSRGGGGITSREWDAEGRTGHYGRGSHSQFQTELFVFALGELQQRKRQTSVRRAIVVTLVTLASRKAAEMTPLFV